MPLKGFPLTRRTLTFGQCDWGLPQPDRNMKLTSLLLVAGLFAAAGCDSERIPKQQAVNDAEKVVAFYLPRLFKDPTLTRDKVFGPSTAPPPLVNEAKRGELAQQSSLFQDQATAFLRGLGAQEFRGLTVTGQSFRGPGPWNTTGDYYLDARRNAVFGQTTFTVSLLVMHPDAFSRNRDSGVEIVNDSRETGVEGVGRVKFLLGAMGLVPANEPPQNGLQSAGTSQFDIRGRLRVYVSHSVVRK
jgi:hypothetical protein